MTCVSYKPPRANRYSTCGLVHNFFLLQPRTKNTHQLGMSPRPQYSVLPSRLKKKKSYTAHDHAWSRGLVTKHPTEDSTSVVMLPRTRKLNAKAQCYLCPVFQPRTAKTARSVDFNVVYHISFDNCTNRCEGLSSTLQVYIYSMDVKRQPESSSRLETMDTS